MIFQTSFMFLRSTLMTFDLYLPFLLVKHHNFSKQKSLTSWHFPQKKAGGGREYDKESDKGVHVHFWAPRQNWCHKCETSWLPGDFCGENFCWSQNGWSEEMCFLSFEFLTWAINACFRKWVHVEQLRLLRSLGVTGAGFFRQPRTKSMTRKRVKIVWTRSRRCSRRCSAQKNCLSFSTVYPVHCSLVVWTSVYIHTIIYICYSSPKAQFFFFDGRGMERGFFHIFPNLPAVWRCLSIRPSEFRMLFENERLMRLVKRASKSGWTDLIFQP